MTKLIQNIPGVIDGKQQKDNHINISQYFESNKDSILYLTEKHYENLVEAFTNNTIDSAFTSNLTSSLPQSSSIFPSSSNQSDIYRIEESEDFHNSKGDIAE
jgi:hypothetical protein